MKYFFEFILSVALIYICFIDYQRTHSFESFSILIPLVVLIALEVIPFVRKL